jgi:hypothetical protein
VVDTADAQSGELPFDPVEPLRRWSDLADAQAELSMGRRGCTVRLSGAEVWLQRLDGGIANAGLVVRPGPHLLRPSSPHSGSVHAFLRAVRRAGFGGASWSVGIDGDGRERLVFIHGDVPVPP